MLEAKRVVKAELPLSLIPNPSPANFHSSRLALHVSDDSASSCWVYVASGRHLYKLQVPLEDCAVIEGKDGLLIPSHTHLLRSSLLDRCPHRSEIQAVVLAQTQSSGYLLLGSVDSYGNAIVSKIDADGNDVDRLTYTVSPHDCGVGESSWAGLCFSPTQLSIAAVARSFCKTIDVYDQDIHVQTLRTCGSSCRVYDHFYRLLYPSSLSFIQNLSNGDGKSILAATEGCQLTIWDLRMKDNGGCLQRICGSVGDIYYAVCSSSTGNIAVGGADRTVTIYDPRRWAAVSRWVHCSKYEVTGLAFSSVDPNYIYIQGVDYEAFCGDWKASNKIFSFRGDSNWLGFSKCHNRDVLGGWCDSGSVFVADVVAKPSELKAGQVNGTLSI